MELLRRELPKYGGTFVQTEDEIAAVSMALGARYAGESRCHGFSGPGHFAQDGGARLGVDGRDAGGDHRRAARRALTGMPTNVEQSDLNIACFGGHGDSPRVVLAAVQRGGLFLYRDRGGTSRANTRRRFSFSPIRARDAHRGVSLPDLEKFCQESRPDFTPVADHKPYDLLDGITRHVAPGTRIADGKYPVVTGLEHDELGHPTGSGNCTCR